MGGGRLRDVVVHGGSTVLTVADPDLQIRVGGCHPDREITGGSKNKGGRGPSGTLPWIRHRFQPRSQGFLLPVPREPGNETALIHDHINRLL